MHGAGEHFEQNDAEVGRCLAIRVPRPQCRSAEAAQDLILRVIFLEDDSYSKISGQLGGSYAEKRKTTTRQGSWLKQNKTTNNKTQNTKEGGLPRKGEGISFDRG